ncbi:hypothetical protein BN1263460229 [Stenotrophomonas indicatrix]|nr:hypothetical protein BN1263460229 [Stenotrophomonas indicatrix]
MIAIIGCTITRFISVGLTPLASNSGPKPFHRLSVDPVEPLQVSPRAFGNTPYAVDNIGRYGSAREGSETCKKIHLYGFGGSESHRKLWQLLQPKSDWKREKNRGS